MGGQFDVVVVGAGNAALCAALAARDAGASVLVLERAPYAERGGNSTFTAGAIRVAYRGKEDIVGLAPDVPPDLLARTDFGTYTEEYLTRAAQASGIEIRYDTAAIGLLTESGIVVGLRTRSGSDFTEVRAGAVILASGGFEANAEWRTRYLGPGWDLAKVRGTRFNNGDGIRMALEIGAMPWGHWSGSHAVGWDLDAPQFGDLAVGDGFQKHSYPFGIMVNARGERFVDEGADFRNYTYAKYGSRILAQPGQFAWQVFDQKVAHLLRDEYCIRQATKVSADTLEQLVARMDGVDPAGFLGTVRNFNAAVRADVPFNPNVRDGRAADGLMMPKSNWANALDTPPYQAFAVTCGVTSTFGGLRISADAEVLDTDAQPIGGLYACGELVGGIFYFNYPGGSGLTIGSVFGRIAGTSAGTATRHPVSAEAQVAV